MAVEVVGLMVVEMVVEMVVAVEVAEAEGISR